MRSVQLKPERFTANMLMQIIKLSGAILSNADFKGFYKATKLIGSMASADQRCEIGIGDKSRYAFRLNDPYWARMVYTGFQYEVELRNMFHRLGDMPFSFFDCGANLGYWSIFCAEHLSSCQSIFAVEASPLTFESLRMNQALNPGKFEIMMLAIYSSSGETVNIECSEKNHAGAGITQGKTADTVEVETISIDDLIAKDRTGGAPVIKLDVEGAEIQALEGARKTIGAECLLAFEDHGSDPSCKVVNHLLTNFDLEIHFLDKTGFTHQIKSVKQAQSFKKSKVVGYNFFATQPGSEFARILRN